MACNKVNYFHYKSNRMEGDKRKNTTSFMINCVVYTRIAASVSKKLNLHLLTQEIYLGSVSFRHQIIPKKIFCYPQLHIQELYT